MKVIGIDPSMSNWGMTTAVLSIESLTFEVQNLQLVETKPSSNKRVRKNSDDLERASAIADVMKETLKDADMVFVEVPHGSQSARAMASYGICIGLLASIDAPMVQLTEREVKLGTIGKATGTKQEMIDWATTKFPDAPWLRQGKRITAKNEHLADATGAIEAGIRGDEFKNILAALKFIKAKAA